MFVVWNRALERYVGKKKSFRRLYVHKLEDAKVYRNKGAIKNSIGLNTSNIPGKNKKVLPPWADIIPVSIQPKEEN